MVLGLLVVVEDAKFVALVAGLASMAVVCDVVKTDVVFAATDCLGVGVELVILFRGTEGIRITCGSLDALEPTVGLAVELGLLAMLAGS